jgi:hypothetical protein
MNLPAATPRASQCWRSAGVKTAAHIPGQSCGPGGLSTGDDFMARSLAQKSA